MSRPRKCRRVACLPAAPRFGPLGASAGCAGTVTMSVDEFEAIRLIDYDGLTQEECAASMAVARTTAQRIYEEARRKLADCLVNARRLHIEGGEYVIAPSGQAGECRCRGGCARCGAVSGGRAG